MGWFNSKKEKSPEDELTELLKPKIFPGGEMERMSRTIAVSELCAHKLNYSEALYVYTKIKVAFEVARISFNGVSKKGVTAEQLIHGAIKDSEGKLNYVEATAIVSYALFGRVENVLASIDSIKTFLIGGFGSDEQGYDTDEIPFGIGEFGLEPTNPIPVRGITGSYVYLNKLRLTDNQPVTSKRIRALKVVDANILVDEYEIYDSRNGLVCKLYICPYHQRISCKAPRGFIVQNS